jgi:tetratricopeptide (TPR) repeat protein
MNRRLLVRCALAAALGAPTLWWLGGRAASGLSDARSADAAEMLRVAARGHVERGDVEGARAAYRRAHDIDSRNGRPWRSLRDAHYLFTSYWETSEYRQAIEYAAAARRDAARAGNDAAQASVLLGLFSILYDIGDLDGADDALRQARPLLPRDHPNAAYVHFNEGLVRSARGQPVAARSAYGAFLRAAPAEHPMRPAAHFNLILLDVAAGDLDAAEAHLAEAERYRSDTESRVIALAYHRALVLNRRGRAVEADAELAALPGSLPLEWRYRAEELRGDILAVLGRSMAAEAAYERAIAAVEELRANLPENELKTWLMAAKRSPYEALFSARMARGALRGALAVAERARARALLDAHIRVSSTDDPGAAPLASAEQAEALRELVADLRTSPAASLPPIEDIIAAAGERTMWTYFRARDSLWLLGLSRGQLQARRLSASRDDIARRVQALLADPDDVVASAWLGAALVPPALLPAPGEILHIAADGLLGEIPFAALLVDGHRLVHRHPVAHVPGLAALAILVSGRRAPSGSPVVMGDARGDLPGARREVQDVAAMLGVSPLTGGHATAAGLRAAARAPLLHLSVHSGVGPRGARLELADGAVGVGDIVERRIAPALVLLPTCTSAGRGPDLWGSIGGAFLAAGSHTVIASLWSIDDDRSSELIGRFYREGGRVDPIGALARAQRALAAAGRPASTWAPFVALGAWPAELAEAGSSAGQPTTRRYR